MRWLAATISLKVSAILPASPAVAGQADGEVAVAHGLEREQEVALVERGIGRRASGAGIPPDLLWIAHETPS